LGGGHKGKKHSDVELHGCGGKDIDRNRKKGKDRDGDGEIEK